MAYMMKKADFLALARKIDNPRVKSHRHGVLLMDGSKVQEEIYVASSFNEAGIISAMNQAEKYRGWLE
jgi:hypothetical protein